MQPNITSKIERYLDQQLSIWTRLLPWRREIATHLQEAYEMSHANAVEEGNDDAAWQNALANFGNVQQVASQLRKEHWPQYIGWRLLATVVALAIVFTVAKPWALLDLPSLGFALIPVTAFVCFDTFRGSTRWAVANRIGTWGCVSGAVAGVVFILTDLENPSYVGAGMALSILSALYCMLFFTPTRMVVVALVFISLVDIGLMLICMHTLSAAKASAILFEAFSPQSWSVDRAWIIRVFALLGCGICLGLARFGFYGITRHAPAVGAGIYLVSLVVMLGDMSDPSKVIGHFLVSLGAMIFAIACGHFISGSSRLMVRLRR